ALRFADPEPLPTFRNAFFDFAQGLLAPPAGDAASAVTIVDIDETSLARLGQWPWPRDLLADLVREIGRHEPSALGVSILFPEPDRLSPESLLQRFPLDAPLRESLQQLPSNDALFAAALADVPAVLGVAVTPFGNGPIGNGSAPQPDGSLDGAFPEASAPRAPILLRLGTQGTTEIRRYPGLLRSLPLLENATSGIGVASIEFASDGVVRRMPIVMLVGDAV